MKARGVTKGVVEDAAVAGLRGTLLPKLLTGEVRVEDMKRVVETK